MVNRGVLQLVFLFIVEYEAVLLDVADYRRFPPRALQERNQAVEDPVLGSSELPRVRNF